MKNHKAVVLMGSFVDNDHAARIIEWLDYFGVTHETRIASAHKTPEKLLKMLNEWENSETDIVFITIAGLSNALSGMVDFATVHPVIACPPPSDAFGGADIVSSLRMPPGVAPAVVLNPQNAALFCAKIFSDRDETLKAKIRAYHATQQEKIDADERALMNRSADEGGRNVR